MDAPATLTRLWMAGRGGGRGTGASASVDWLREDVLCALALVHQYLDLLPTGFSKWADVMTAPEITRAGFMLRVKVVPSTPDENPPGSSVRPAPSGGLGANTEEDKEPRATVSPSPLIRTVLRAEATVDDLLAFTVDPLQGLDMHTHMYT